MFSLLAFCSLLAIGFCQQQEVAFSYGLTHDVSYTSQSIIVYNARFSNFGGAYDETTGKFIAPAPGIYVFQFHLLTQSGGTGWIELYKNANYQCTAYGHNTNDFNSAGNSIILQLDKGDQIYIQSVDASLNSNIGSDIYGRPDEIYSTFSGYMISPVYQEIPGHNGK